MSIDTQYTVTNNWVCEEFKTLAINCGRTLKRFIKTMITLSKKPNESISAASEDRAEAKAIYRLIANKNLTEEVILNAHKKATIKKITESGEKVILSVQDTSDLNYTSHKGTIGLGNYCSEKNAKGLIVHTSIAVTTEGVSLGILDQKIWTRDPKEHGKSNDKKNRPIEEKESFKWLESMDRSNADIPNNIKIVNVCDREADVYEFFSKAITDDRFFLVRIVQNRKTDEECKLFEKIQNEKAAGEIVVEIPRDTRRNIKKRNATLEVKYTKIKVIAPPKLQDKYGKNGFLEYYVILAKEINPPEGIDPIEWYLATNVQISSFDEAMEKVRWYIQRWKIERFHYVLKSGCEIEKLQERDAIRLKKLILMYSIIAIRILCITYLSRQTPDASCEEIFEENEWKVLYCIANKTSEVINKVPTIKEAVSYLAKLGGFLGRNGDGEPGAKVIWKGLKELNIVLQHYKYLIPK
jgi:hypothetical protein